MNILAKIANTLTNIFGQPTQKSISSFATESGLSAIRFGQNRKENQKNKPTYCVLSHSENYDEMAAILHMSTRLQQVQGPDNMADLVFLSAENSPRTMEETVMPALHSSDVGRILTPSLWTTYCLGQEFDHNPLPAPVVFAGVQNIKNIRSLHRNKENSAQLTGVQHKPLRYEEFVADIEETMPGVRRILVPCSREISTKTMILLGYGFNDDKREVFSQRGIRITPVPVGTRENIGTVLSKYLRKRDGVLITDDSVAVVGLPQILKAAADHQVPVFAENSIAVLRGASLGIGGNMGQEGPILADMMHKLETGIVSSASEIPIVTKKRDEEIRFNEHAFKKQGVHVSSKRMRALRMRSIFAGE